MAYSNTKDEKSTGGLYSPVYLDAPASTNTTFTLASTFGKAAYGLLNATGYSADTDAYSMGVLYAGSYYVSASKSYWFWGSGYDNFVMPIVTIYNADGTVLTGGGKYSYSATFNVYVANTFYVSVSGSASQSSQYELYYTYTPPVNNKATSDLVILGATTIDGTARISGTYSDLNGTTYSKPTYTWVLTGLEIGSTSSTYKIKTADAGKILAVILEFYDDAGNYESVGTSIRLPSAPVATAASITTNEDTVITGILTASDVDLNVLKHSAVNNPSNGIVSIASNGAYTYTPNINFSGTDSFTFKANDGELDSVAATVSITVNAVNDPPIATSASITNIEDNAKTGTLTATDIESTSLTYSKVDSPTNGTVTVNTNGAYTYTPNANFNGTDSFTFKVNDGSADSAAATVSFTVSAVNDAPVGTIDITGTAKQGETLTATKNFTDVDGIPVVGTLFTTSWLADGTPINSIQRISETLTGGFIASSLVLTPELVGKKISFSTAYTDNGGTQETVTSAQTSDVAGIATSGTGTSATAKFWKDNTKTPADTKKADAVNLTDAIAILKMIVGLNVNSNNTPLTPYQAIAADFDQSGDVGLTDAIGVLKMVVGLTAPTPTWKYYDDTKLASAYSSTQSLNPKGWTTTALISDTTTAESSVKLVGVLTGDVDGSWIGA
jgi:VCBS repeat-containing protein